MDAEQAFLQSMQNGDTEQYGLQQSSLQVPVNAVDQDDGEDDDPSSLTPAAKSQDLTNQPTPSTEQNFPDTDILTPDLLQPSNSSPTTTDLPSKPLPTASVTPNSQSREPSVSAKQPRTIGGFIVDDEDDEEDTSVIKSGATGADGKLNVDRGLSNTPQRSSIKSPSSPRATTDVVNPVPTEAQGSSGDVPDTDSAVQNAVIDVSSAGAPAEDSNTRDQPLLTAQTPTSSVFATDALANRGAKARLPHDRVGLLEDRIKEDPRGDMDAWLTLINDHRRRHKLDDARKTYDRFFKVFPTAAEQWVAYADMELDTNDFYRVEQIFNKSLLTCPSVHLWSTYLNYVRRRNNLTTDPTGNARQVVSQAYDFVLQNIGIDKDAGQIWQDYVQFIRSGPGQVGGTSWQDQQKMDLLRKTYQRAVCIPTKAINLLWKDYDAFEMGLNKVTGRKFTKERSPAYMEARSAHTVLQNLTRDLDLITLPKMPPALGFDGDVEYMRQVDIWKKWINWEKNDPLLNKDDDFAAYRDRVFYLYRQATVVLRFWPEIWADAADFCFSNDLDSEGHDFLNRGAEANPESFPIAVKLSDRLETKTKMEEGDEGAKRKGEIVRDPYDKVLDALYSQIEKVKHKEALAIARITEAMSQPKSPSPAPSKGGEGEDEDDGRTTDQDVIASQQVQIDAVKRGNLAQIKLLSKNISFVWIALMRAMRRIQGKGGPGSTVGGFRQVFTDARKRGKLTSDVYIASALLEYHCYKDPAATKIFERGLKLFPEDEHFALAYLKHLVAINDLTNARAVFETTVNRLARKSELIARAKPLYIFFHQFEAQHGELSQIVKLEKRMQDLFPEENLLQVFAQRYSTPEFDPFNVRLILSPSQVRPKVLATIEKPASIPTNSPRQVLAGLASITNSPKRAFEDSDNESVLPRKIPRAESPLKGAAGRRLDAQKRTQLRNELSQTAAPIPPAPALPREVMYLLSIIPGADKYNAQVFNAEKMVDLLRSVDLSNARLPPPNSASGLPSMPATQGFAPGAQGYPYGQANGPYGYGR